MKPTSARMSALDEFINEIATTPFGEMRGPSVTAAGDHKRLAIERWENEGGAIPRPFELVTIVRRWR